MTTGTPTLEMALAESKEPAESRLVDNAGYTFVEFTLEYKGKTLLPVKEGGKFISNEDINRLDRIVSAHDSHALMRSDRSKVVKAKHGLGSGTGRYGGGITRLYGINKQRQPQADELSGTVIDSHNFPFFYKFPSHVSAEEHGILYALEDIALPQGSTPQPGDAIRRHNLVTAHRFNGIVRKYAIEEYVIIGKDHKLFEGVSSIAKSHASYDGDERVSGFIVSKQFLRDNQKALTESCEPNPDPIHETNRLLAEFDSNRDINGSAAPRIPPSTPNNARYRTLEFRVDKSAIVKYFTEKYDTCGKGELIGEKVYDELAKLMQSKSTESRAFLPSQHKSFYIADEGSFTLYIDGGWYNNNAMKAGMKAGIASLMADVIKSLSDNLNGQVIARHMAGGNGNTVALAGIPTETLLQRALFYDRNAGTSQEKISAMREAVDLYGRFKAEKPSNFITAKCHPQDISILYETVCNTIGKPQ